MKDNLPNYLNLHNMNAGRVEPARIDTPPGNDSIRADRMQATQPMEMTLETAIDILKFVEGNIYERIAIRKVIEALSSADDINAARSLWVKTADRLPDKCDDTKYLIARHRICREWHTLQVSGIYIKKFPMHCPYWTTIPPLPEEVYR